MRLISKIALLLFFLVSEVFGTDKIQTVLVTTPIYHPLDEGGVKFARIPVTGWDIDNLYYTSGFYSGPIWVFEKDNNLKQDVNLISAYKLKLMSNLKTDITTIYISTALAFKPKTHHFSIQEVVEFTKKSVRTDHPNKNKYIIVVTENKIKEIQKMISEN